MPDCSNIIGKINTLDSYHLLNTGSGKKVPFLTKKASVLQRKKRGHGITNAFIIADLARHFYAVCG